MSPPQRFELTDEHVALLRAAYVDADEYGNPRIDPKRPFGSSGPSGYDIDDVLGGHRLRDDDDIPASRRRRYDALYRELATALQVVLRAGSFEPGVYEASAYGTDWTLVEARRADLGARRRGAR